MDKRALGQVFSKNFGFPCLSTFHLLHIIFIITRGWHNRPGVVAVPIASQSRIKKKYHSSLECVSTFAFVRMWCCGKSKQESSGMYNAFLQQEILVLILLLSESVWSSYITFMITSMAHDNVSTITCVLQVSVRSPPLNTAQRKKRLIFSAAENRLCCDFLHLLVFS
jgi:hypothetical protein